MSAARKLLYPFSLLYSGVTALRNELYDHGIFKSNRYDLPVIAVGNLSVGGTGKSPMVEYLIGLLKDGRQVATLSRGYKRSTSGFYLLTGKETAAEVGDEPLQFKMKFPNVLVAVDEDRSHGIEELLKLDPKPEVILLDDAFQHRRVKADFYILLTPFENLYSKDLVLPAGNLREPKSGAKRADIVVVTKCPENISPARQQEIQKELKLEQDQKLFFSKIAYSEKVYSAEATLSLSDLLNKKVTLVTGIANPKPLVAHLRKKGLEFVHLNFPDHHNFSTSEISDLRSKECILTTEKDYMRLKNDISKERLFYLPIKTTLLENTEEFEKLIKELL